MIITYKIVSVIPDEHQIKVRFYSDTLPESELVSAWMEDGVTPRAYRTDYLITLPYPAPQGAELDNYIMRFCPVDWFRLKEQLSTLNNVEIPVTVGDQKSVTV